MSRSLQPFQVVSGVPTPMDGVSSTTAQRSIAVKNAYKWLGAPKIRKCRDFLALIFFAGTLAFTAYLLGGSDKYKVKTNSKKISYYLIAADSFRRVCGSATQPDTVSPSYAWFVNKRDQVYRLCLYYQTLEAKSIVPGTKQFYRIACERLLNPGEYNAVAQQLFKLIGELDNDMSAYTMGFKVDEMVCIPAAEVTAACKPVISPATAEAVQVCHHEIKYLVELMRLKVSSGGNAKQQALKDTLDSITGQFLTQPQYDALFKTLEKNEPDLKFLTSLCVKMPTASIQTYYQKYVPTTFTFDNVAPKCIINFQKAIKDNFGSIQMVSIYLEYLTMAFDQPISTAIQELDQSWKNLAIALAFSIGLTLVYQFLMYFTARILIYIAILGLIGCIVFFIYYALDYAVQLTDLNTQYYLEYGVQNMRGQVNQVLMYVVCAALILLGLLVLSMSCLLFSLADIVARSIAVVRECFKKIWTVSIIPLILIAIVFVHIGFYLYVIIIHTTVGQINARTSVFMFVDTFASNDPKYDSTAIVIVVFYVVQLLHGIFACLNVMQYIVGAAAIQFYFTRQSKGKVCRTFKWAFLNIGSLLAEAYVSVFLVWLRPIFEWIVEKQPYLPENAFLRGVVRFSRWYVSLCSSETIFAIALTGQSHRKSARTWRSFMIQDKTVTHTISNALSLFNMLGKLFISLASWILISTLADTGADVQTVRFIWVNIISFFLSYIIASFITNLTTYIMSALMFCWNYEAVVGAGKIICEPEELKKLRTIVTAS